MDNIKIITVDSKTTKTNKPYKMCTVECNSETRKVNIWSNAPDFANLKEGSVFLGNMKKEGDYWNISFEGQNSAPRASGGFKTAQAKEVVDYKDTKIGKRMDDKDFSIMTSSTMRDAVSLAIAEIKDITTLNTLEQDILKWRQWLLDNWEVDPKSIKPF